MMVNRGALKSGSLCPWGPNQKARPLCPARQSLESELRNPRGLWRLAGAASNLTAVRPSGPEGSAACFPNAQERGGPHSFLKPHLLVQIIGPFFFRNLKARFAIPKLNGIRVPHWPRWSGSLRSATWAGCALRPRGGRNAEEWTLVEHPGDSRARGPKMSRKILALAISGVLSAPGKQANPSKWALLLPSRGATSWPVPNVATVGPQPSPPAAPREF